MLPEYEILNTVPQDLPFIYGLYEAAMDFHRENGYPVWNGYDREVIEKEVQEKRQYKIVSGNEILLVFSLTYTDPIVWRDYEQGDAIYLHRIAINPAFRGQRLFGQVLAWCVRHAAELDRPYLRLDTWGNNHKMIAYYESFGFEQVDTYTTPDAPGLPIPQRNLYIALMEYKG